MTGLAPVMPRHDLELATESGVRYAGVLCGRATWQNGISVYANEGVSALEDWLADRGAKNIQALDALLVRGASAWWNAHGGQDNIEVIESNIGIRSRERVFYGSAIPQT